MVLLYKDLLCEIPPGVQGQLALLVGSFEDVVVDIGDEVEVLNKLISPKR